MSIGTAFSSPAAAFRDVIAARVVTASSPEEYAVAIYVVASIAVLLAAYQAYIRAPKRGMAPEHRWFVFCLAWAIGTAILALRLGFCLVFLPVLPALSLLRDEAS
jgi:hypothetical protein